MRYTALQILNALSHGHQTLDHELESYRQKEPLSEQRDRALLQAIVFGVLRWRGRLDFIIAAFSSTPLHKIQPDILNVLRIGLFQAAFLERIPASAAVNTAVELAKPLAPSWVVRFVNAVLRKAANDHATVRFPDLEKNPVASLAAVKSFPPWLIRRWLHRFGQAETAALCDAVNAIPPVTLRTNSLQVDRKTLMTTLNEEGESVQATPQAPEGVWLLRPRKPIPELGPFQRGWFQVQDEAAQMVTHLLAPQPGERIMDACAGWGGKTGHIAQRMQNAGEIVAVDAKGNKLNELSAEMKRLGVQIVAPECLDLLSDPLPLRPGSFDRILLDAPCSGLGVLRRNPDAKWRLKERMLGRFGQKQTMLLDCLAPLVKTGGLLVYSVCSSEPEEGRGVVTAFLDRHPEYRTDSPVDRLPQPLVALLTKDGFFETYPHRHGMDGFFGVRFKRIQ